MVKVPDASDVTPVGVPTTRTARADLASIPAAGLGQGFQAVGAGLSQAQAVLQREEEIAEAELERKERELERAEQRLELERFESELIHRGSQIMEQRRKDSSRTPRGFAKGFDDEFENVANEMLSGRQFDDIMVQRALERFERQRRKFLTQARIFEQNTVTAALADDVSDELQSLALGVLNNPASFDEAIATGGQMIDTARAAGIITPAAAEDAVEKFEQNAAIQALRGFDDPSAALKLLRDGEFDAEIRDPDVKTRLLKELKAASERLTLAERVELNELVVKARQAAAIEESGRQVADTEEIVDSLSAFSNNAQAVAAVNTLNDARNRGVEIREFITSTPIAEQRQEILEINSRLAAGELTTEEATLGAAKAKAHDTFITGLSTVPFETAASFGIIDEPDTISFTDADTLVRRKQQAEQIEAATGIHVPPLEAGEIDALENLLKTQDAPVVSAQLATLRDAFGHDGVADLAGQMRNVNQGLSVALLHSVHSLQSASQIVDGLRLKDENSDLVPTKADREVLLAEKYGNLFQALGDVRAPMIEAADAIYVKWAIRNGIRTFDGSLYGQALEMVAGGQISNDGSVEGGPLRWRGQTIFPVDFGASRAATIDTFMSLTDSDLDEFGSGIPVDTRGRVISAADMVAHGELVSVGIGKYLIRLGDGFVLRQNADGIDNKYILDLLEFRREKPEQIGTFNIVPGSLEDSLSVEGRSRAAREEAERLRMGRELLQNR